MVDGILDRTETARSAIQAPAKAIDSVLLRFCWIADFASIAGLGIMRHDVFGKCKDAGLSVELNPVCGIRGKFDLAGFSPKPSDYIPNRTCPPELRQQ